MRHRRRTDPAAGTPYNFWEEECLNCGDAFYATLTMWNDPKETFTCDCGCVQHYDRSHILRHIKPAK